MQIVVLGVKKRFTPTIVKVLGINQIKYIEFINVVDFLAACDGSFELRFDSFLQLD